MVFEWAVLHHAELVANWRLLQQHDAPLAIAPPA
ncbi:MAG: hypothetical protein ACREQM_12385 [Candidatus Dormibacteraceae bacterium]